MSQQQFERNDTGFSIPQEITTPEFFETRLGRLEFKDGAPSEETVTKVYDNLDFNHALNAYLNTYQGASTFAIHEGLKSIGVEDNNVLIFSELMDSNSLFLTANCDTIYAMSIINLSKGPVVIETPPKALGAVDDMWFNWVIDLGAPGPDRGQGGKYLLLPPDYTGYVPESGYSVARCKTTRAMAFMRFFLENDDPKPVVERIKKYLKIYSYAPGGYGTSIASILNGEASLSENLSPDKIPSAKFIEGSGKAFNTIPASDFHFFEQINQIVQAEPATSLDPELKGQLSAIGIVKGKPFQPDDRMKKIMIEAAAVGVATGRSLNYRFRNEQWPFYDGSSWVNFLFEGGYTFETPPPMISKEGVKPFPRTGARTLDARTTMFFAYTGVSPGMCMRLTNIGSQYLITAFDADGNYFDGAKHYKLHLPDGIPAASFWSVTLYDNQTRSMLQTEQRFPRSGSQSYPLPAAVEDNDGSIAIHICPIKPGEVDEGNWIQTLPEKGWFAILRLYSPLQSFFDKSWRPGEIELVNEESAKFH